MYQCISNVDSVSGPYGSVDKDSVGILRPDHINGIRRDIIQEEAANDGDEH